jgi:pimeloyl-ACP methyl ester carboxylesterase
LVHRKEAGQDQAGAVVLCAGSAGRIQTLFPQSGNTKDFDAGRKINMPTLILWGATGGVGRNTKPSPGEIWQHYASNIIAAKTVPSGHYLSEEAPVETTAALREFFAAAS